MAPRDVEMGFHVAALCGSVKPSARGEHGLVRGTGGKEGHPSGLGEAPLHQRVGEEEQWWCGGDTTA